MALKKAYLIIFLTILFLMVNCEGPAGPEGPEGPAGEQGPQGDTIYDKIVRIPIQVAFTWREADTLWSGYHKDALVYNFNIEDYTSVDQAIFIAQFDRRPDETTDSLWLRLYDYTNLTSITNSELWSIIDNNEFENDPSKRVFSSLDIFNSLNKGEITLGIQYRKQLDIIDSRRISIHNAEILLYRSTDSNSKMQITELLNEIRYSN